MSRPSIHIQRWELVLFTQTVYTSLILLNQTLVGGFITMARDYYWLLLCVGKLAAVVMSAHFPHGARGYTSTYWAPVSSSTSAANGAATVSVASFLDKAIAALGAHDAINKLRGIRSHA
jgi:hypothetical protein